MFSPESQVIIFVPEGKKLDGNLSLTQRGRPGVLAGARAGPCQLASQQAAVSLPVSVARVISPRLRLAAGAGGGCPAWTWPQTVQECSPAAKKPETTGSRDALLVLAGP